MTYTLAEHGAGAKIPAGDFEPADAILEHAWRETLTYFEQTWRAVLWYLGGHPKPAINRHLKTGN